MNKKGFTLIELLAVIIILGVIMTIAVPNVLSMIDRNKKDTLIENAKSMATLAEYTIRKDTKIDYPSEGNAIIMTLEYLNTDDITESPYGTLYSPSRSFVAIVNQTQDGITEYKYYVHLVACVDAVMDDESLLDSVCTLDVNKNMGIDLVNVDLLSGIDEDNQKTSNRFMYVKQDVQLTTNLGKVTYDNKMEKNDEIVRRLGIKEKCKEPNDTCGIIENVYHKLP